MAYAYELLEVDVGGGPTSGGTLVTLSGRGFTRAAARAATAPQRYGNLNPNPNPNPKPKPHPNPHPNPNPNPNPNLRRWSG